MKIFHLPFFTLLFLPYFFFTSCQNSPQQSTGKSFNTTPRLYPLGYSPQVSPIKYAKGFNIHQLGNNKVVTVYKPGTNKKVLQYFFLINKADYIAEIDRKKEILLPLDSIAVFSATQLNALDKLGLLDKVIGVSEANYIRNEHVQDRYNQGLITELAGNGSFFVEKTLQINPTVIFYSPYNTSESHPLAATKIPMVSYLDFMEEDPLGRAEWIKFTAVFFGKEKLADSLFKIIEGKYNEYKEIAANAASKPSVFSDKYFNGQWFVPGGQSYVAKLFADANADYVWKENQQSGSFPLDFEVVYNEAGKADFWRIIGSYNEKPGYENLAQENELYTHFKAFQEHHVIYCDAEKTAYFENSPLEPQVLLADLIKAFHPELLPDYQPVYYKVIP